MFWVPVSMVIAKMLLKHRGPVKGRLRRKLAKKAYDLTSDFVQVLSAIGYIGPFIPHAIAQCELHVSPYALDPS